MNTQPSLTHAAPARAASRFLRWLLLAIVLAGTVQAQAESATYVIDPAHTFVTFEVTHFGTSTLRGRWDKKEGQVTIDRAAHTGRAQITIDMQSVSTGTDAFNRFLLGKNGFNVAANPQAFFVATQFTFDGDNVASVTGELTLNGKSGEATLKATRFHCYTSPMLKTQVCGGDFETTIKRSDFGLTFGVPFVSDDTHLLIQIEAIKQ